MPHVVLERGSVGETWRGRWDSFCLVTPNWTVQLPEYPYDGPDPDGFMLRDELVGYLHGYAARIDAPVREGVDVTSLGPAPGGGFELDTSAGRLEAANVVVSTGAYQRPHRPAGAAALPHDLLQLDVEGYRNPDELPPGPVLVVGSGQSGCQIAEELVDAGRTVFLSCGRAPWGERRVGDHDLVWWAFETGFIEQSVDALQSPADRLIANILTSGRDGGHDLHLRTLQAQGVIMLGHFVGAEGGHARFAPDLDQAVAWGDDRRTDFMNLVLRHAAEHGMPRPEIPEPPPFAAEPIESVPRRGFGAVVFAGGFRPDYASWINVPGAFDDLGFPIHDERASTAADGLYFVGVHFLRTRKSSLFAGVGEDAAIVAGGIVARHR
jgi:putative flavoprotein involved in K+ transport